MTTSKAKPRTLHRGYIHVHTDPATPPVLIWAGRFGGIPVAFSVLGRQDDDPDRVEVARVAKGKAPGLYGAVVRDLSGLNGLATIRVRLGRRLPAGVASEIAALEHTPRKRGKAKRGKAKAPTKTIGLTPREARTLIDALRRTVLPRTQPAPTQPAEVTP